MERKDLEVRAKQLALTYTKETSDETLALMIELAESREENAALADAVAKLETGKELKTDLPIIKVGKKLYQTTCKQFVYNPHKWGKETRGAGGLMNRTLQSENAARTVNCADLEKDENKPVVAWLIEHNSPLLVEVSTTKEEGGK